MPHRLHDRIAQRTLDVVDAAERLATTLPPGDGVGSDATETAIRLLRCLALIEERPCATWALEELRCKAARLAATFDLAAIWHDIDEDQRLEGRQLCDDLGELARSLCRQTTDGERPLG